MDINSVQEAAITYTTYSTNNSSTKANQANNKELNKEKNNKATTDPAAVYEPSSTDKTKEKTNVYAKPEIVEQMKADQKARLDQLQSLVRKMFEKQGITIGSADDMWKVLASGNFTVDAETKAQAQKDISEDGYWGVKQTSDRIFSFAMALSGGDEEQMKKMQKAFEKGFGEATKAWGSTLPGISQDTYNAVSEKFQDYYNSLSDKSTTDKKEA